MSDLTPGTVFGVPASLAICAAVVLVAILLLVAVVAWIVVRRVDQEDLPVTLLGLAHVISALCGLLPWGKPTPPPAFPEPRSADEASGAPTVVLGRRQWAGAAGGSVTGVWRSAEPRPRVERVTGMGELLSSIPEPSAIAVLAHLLYGASEEAIAERLGVMPQRVPTLIGKGVSMMRHPMRSRAWVECFDTEGQVVLVDEGLRALIRKWRLEELAPECLQCRSRYTPKRLKLRESGGRPRQYCSNACRQKAYRARYR